MTKLIVNLTLPIVKEEIECLLETYPAPSYWQTFENPDLCQELIAYVLSRVPNFYTVVETEEQAQLKPTRLSHSLEQRMKIETLIHQGVQQILQTNLERAYSNSSVVASL